MAKFEMGAAWEDSVALLKSHTALTGAVAAVFLFLPALAVSWFGPSPIEAPAGASVTQIVETIRANLMQALPYQIPVGLLSLIGTVAIMRLWLARTSTSVGESLAFSLMAFVTVLIVQILVGLALFVGFFLFLVPGLYLVGRLALVLPAIADRGFRNPLDAIASSWKLTEGNGWLIFLFLFLVTIVMAIGGMIVGGVATLVGTDGLITQIFSGVIVAAFGAVTTMVSLAVSTAAYRQLAVENRSDLFL